MPEIPVPLGPIMLTPLAVERIWGTDTLHSWYGQPQPGRPVGEVWLTEEHCVVQGSERTLAELATERPAAFGNIEGDGFPLLIKLLYPREKLSVQVHPDDAQAQATLGQSRGKTECWYVLSAEPGAEIALGFRDPMTAEALRLSIEEGTIESKLRMLPVHPGDMIFVDAGTVHAIGPGMVVLETQQYSDVTYRLWDYGRSRELHIEAGLAVARTVTQAGRVEPTSMAGFDRLIACPYFRVDRFRLEPGAPVRLGMEHELQVLIALGDAGTLQSEAGPEISLQAGYAVLVPAGAPEQTLAALQAVEVIRVLGPVPGNG